MNELCVSILVIFISIMNLEAMIPDKHLPMAKSDRGIKLETDSMEIDTIKADTQNLIPVVITAHSRQISLHWWGQNSWKQTKVVDHDSLNRLKNNLIH